MATSGTSALFLMSSDATIDRVAEEFKGMGMHLIKSNLSNEQEAQLNELFAA